MKKRYYHYLAAKKNFSFVVALRFFVTFWRDDFAFKTQSTPWLSGALNFFSPTLCIFPMKISLN